MKIAINALLVLVSLLLIYLLIETIRKPIVFQETREVREEVVKARLLEIVELQKMHKDLRKNYAGNFDSLKHVLTNDTFVVEVVTGDQYDTTVQVRKDTMRLPAKDSLTNYLAKKAPGQSIDEYFAQIRLVPFSDNKEFDIDAGEAIVEGTDSFMTPTFEVGTALATYLAEFDKESHALYDPNYDPENQKRKVGDLYKPSTSGNW